MSTSAAQSFYQKLQSDTKLQADLQRIQAAHPDGGDEATKALIALARKQGFELSESDMQAFMKSEAEAQAAGGAELSDEQLEAVAGGKGKVTLGCGCAWPFKSNQLYISRR